LIIIRTENSAMKSTNHLTQILKILIVF